MILNFRIPRSIQFQEVTFTKLGDDKVEVTGNPLTILQICQAPKAEVQAELDGAFTEVTVEEAAESLGLAFSEDKPYYMKDGVINEKKVWGSTRVAEHLIKSEVFSEEETADMLLGWEALPF